MQNSKKYRVKIAFYFVIGPSFFNTGAIGPGYYSGRANSDIYDCAGKIICQQNGYQSCHLSCLQSLICTPRKAVGI